MTGTGEHTAASTPTPGLTVGTGAWRDDARELATSFESLRRKRAQRAVKALLDRAGALVLLVLLSPLMLALAVWVLVDDGRPVLFRQWRAGRAGKPFLMWKYRTMVNNAVEIGRQMQISDDPFGIVANDPRITRSGRFLRRSSLDELPQLVNVLRGQMSMVGPRPDLVEQAAHYSDADRRRLAVRPGITGWSQVHGRDEIEWPERIRQDVWYIENWSLLLDLKIAIATFGQFFRDEPNPVEDRMNIERARDGEGIAGAGAEGTAEAAAEGTAEAAAEGTAEAVADPGAARHPAGTRPAASEPPAARD